MTEQDYIKATNRVKVSAALHLIRDVLPGDDFGMSESEHKVIIVLLRDAETKLFSSLHLENSE